MSLVFGVFTILVFSPIVGIGCSQTVKTIDHDEFLDDIAHFCYDEYFTSEIHNYKKLLQIDRFKSDESQEKKDMYCSLKGWISSGPIDSAWPMKCLDRRHTAQSSYSTTSNPNGVEVWNFKCDMIETSPTVGEDGTIYFGTMGSGDELYALHPNGTLKWKYETDMWIWGSSPAIDEDGTIYICSWDDYLHAIHPNGTRKWRFYAEDSISSSPAIADDGTIYFGTMGDGYRIFAINPDGTEKWRYQTGYKITSDPAIGDDGTIYIGSGDNYLYALYPNGTLQWRFKTGHYVKGPPSIANDGTIYIGSWDDYVYALYPNGTMRWRHKVGAGTESNPSIGLDGIIYIGGGYLYAIYPNGTRKWTFDFGSNVHTFKSCPAIDSDGIIYIGTHVGDGNGGELVAVNHDGALRWRKTIANYRVDSSPCIGKDGTVYIGSSSDNQGYTYGYLHAFGRGELIADAGGPYNALIYENITFKSTIWGGIPPYEYLWEFGDGSTSIEEKPEYSYNQQGNYTVTLTVTDAESNVSVDTTLAYIRSPPSKPEINGPNSGHFGEEYEYTFTAIDPESDDIWYYVDWGDGSNSGWLGPYSSGEVVTKSHTWDEENTYTIRAKAKDIFDEESYWGTLEVTMPVNKPPQFPIISWLLERFPNAFPILRQLLGL
jgi:outer membrane protein assembly factor BamB